MRFPPPPLLCYIDFPVSPISCSPTVRNDLNDLSPPVSVGCRVHSLLIFKSRFLLFSSLLVLLSLLLSCMIPFSFFSAALEVFLAAPFSSSLLSPPPSASLFFLRRNAPSLFPNRVYTIPHLSPPRPALGRAHAHTSPKAECNNQEISHHAITGDPDVVCVSYSYGLYVLRWAHFMQQVTARNHDWHAKTCKRNVLWGPRACFL